MRYYNLYVDNTNDLFTYMDKDDEYEIGERVIVTFRGKKKSGIIVEEDIKEEREFKVLPILSREKSGIKLSKNYIKLLLWIKKQYLATYESIFSAVVPNKLSVDYKEIYIVDDIIGIYKDEEIDQELKGYFLQKIGVKKGTLKKYISQEDIEYFVKSEIIAIIEDRYYLTKKGMVLSNDIQYLKSKMYLDKKNVDKNFSKSKIDKLKEKKYISQDNRFVKKDKIIVESIDSRIKQESKQLNEEQEKAKNTILQGKGKYYLLKGITGSGKTEVYISLIKEYFSKGKGTIFLVPEISLTPQMIERFKGEFRENIAILHSKLSDKDRAKEWYSIYKGEKKIVLGVRSAVLAPVENLGLIILDEEHENTYKQEQNPRYHARQVALKRMEIEDGKVVLGSATPAVESYYYAQKGLFTLVELKKRYNNAILPEIEIVDMKKEDSTYFSGRLLEEIRKRLLRNEQVLLLLNRKGYSTYIQCKDCGYVEECKHCSIKYSYYASQNILKCNYCGEIKKYSGHCTNCGSKNIVHSGKGTERVEEELKKYFDVNIIRVDSEISKERDFYENMYRDFSEGKYQIMVGTQMISKGLHFPNVTLVGVINSDTILNFPDFRAMEKTFQLITQVAGRAGRGDKKGKVIVQTYQKENMLFDKIQKSDYEGFYKNEIFLREKLSYPPFSKAINIGISSENEEYLKEQLKGIKESLKNNEVEVYGPMPALVYKVKNRYRYNVFVKGERTKINHFKNFLKKLLVKFERDSKIRVVVDIEPVNLI